MGLGKSVQTLALLDHERAVRCVPGAPQEAAPQTGHTLLVCPMSLVGNWQREAERFTPDLAVHVHHGSDRLSGAELHAALAGADLVITTYALAARDREALAAVPWRRVVCDEAQNIKNAGTRQSRAVRALPAGSRLALTGTPVENHLGELWSIMEFTSPGLLGPAEKFRESFAVPVQRHGDEEAAARLKRLTGPFILRRVKTDRSIISDLPDKVEMKIWCTLTPEQASLYQATVTDMLARIDAAEADIERRGLVLATMAKLKQVCNHPAHLLGDGSRLPGRSGKLARLEEICDEIVAAGDKALCFTQYAEFGRVLQPYLAARLGCPVLYLHGGTAKKTRDALVAEFQEAEGAGRLPALAEGRRHRAEPHRGQPCHSLRPLVEPGRRGSGHRPRLPHRAAQGRAGPQVRLRGHAGGADRRHDRGQEGAGRADRRHGRGLAHRAVHVGLARCAGAGTGGGAGVKSRVAGARVKSRVAVPE